jgi:hypothetical protein
MGVVLSAGITDLSASNLAAISLRGASGNRRQPRTRGGRRGVFDDLGSFCQKLEISVPAPRRIPEIA